jgi:predicted nucleic-acid-binding Zn-ribbon protein
VESLTSFGFLLPQRASGADGISLPPCFLLQVKEQVARHVKPSIGGINATFFMKTCSKCKKELDESCFSPSSGGKYLRPECRKCGYKLSKQRKLLREKYGDPPSGYKCPICLKGEHELQGTGGRASIWVVDHNHDTNVFRGHICHNCNRGLGVFQDDVSRFLRAIEYLNNNS